MWTAQSPTITPGPKSVLLEVAALVGEELALGPSLTANPC